MRFSSERLTVFFSSFFLFASHLQADQFVTHTEKPIHREIQNLASGNVGASDLQQAQPLSKQDMCKHMSDAESCKDEDADAANGQILNHDVYKVEEPFPWLTGPLLTPSGHVIPKGHWNIEPYEFVNTTYGIYNHRWRAHDIPHNFYSASTQLPIKYGLGHRLDFEFTPAFSWNHTHGASHWVLNDMGFGIDYQIRNEEKGKWWPAIKLALNGNFPFGKFQHLETDGKRTDIGGVGSWLPTAGIVMSHLYWWGGHIFFAARMNWQYTFPTPVHVRGFNTYGGGRHTCGKVYPGQILIGQFGFELTLSQRWALAGDVQYQHINKTRFKGQKGSTAGVPNTVGAPSSDQWSLAPAIEYDWNAYVGIIAGVWFTVAARNSPQFANAVVAINIYK